MTSPRMDGSSTCSLNMDGLTSNLVSLVWNDHINTLSSSLFHEYQSSQTNGEIHISATPIEESLTDCTLICDDGVKVNAHRIILAASSHYFSEVIKSTTVPNSYTHFVLNNIRSDILKLLLEYIYKGEVRASSEDLEMLIAAADCLKVKGIMRIPSGMSKPFEVHSDRDQIRYNTHVNRDLVLEESTVNKKRKIEDSTTTSDEQTFSYGYSYEMSNYTLPSRRCPSALNLSDSAKERLFQNSDSQSQNDYSCSKFLKEETPIGNNSNIKSHFEDETDDLVQHRRSHSPLPGKPSICTPLTMIHGPPYFPFYSDALYQLKNTPLHRPVTPESISRLRYPLETINDSNQLPLFMKQTSNNNIPPYQRYSISPLSADEAPNRDPLNIRQNHRVPSLSNPNSIPSANISPPQGSPSPQKKTTVPPGFLTPGVPPLIPSHSYAASLATMLSYRLDPQLAANQNLDLYGHRDLSEAAAANSITVKKDLGALEDDRGYDHATRTEREKKIPNGLPLSDYNIQNNNNNNNNKDNNTKILRATSPTSLENNTTNNTINNQYLPSDSNIDNNNINNISKRNKDKEEPYINSTNNATVKNEGSPASASSTTTSVPSTSTDISSSNNSSGFSNPGFQYSSSFVNVSFSANSSKPEWKRYKQYSKTDLHQAIEEVKNGATALQAARKYKVPSRTLYDKIKKLGVSTTARRVTTGSSKLRSPHNSKLGCQTPGGIGSYGSMNIDGSPSLDYSIGGCGGSVSLGPESAESGDDPGRERDISDEGLPIVKSESELSSMTMASGRTNNHSSYSSMPGHTESSNTKTDIHNRPLDLQVLSSASGYDVDAKGPLSLAENISHQRRLIANQSIYQPYKEALDMAEHHPCAPKSILDLLPRQASNCLTEQRSKEHFFQNFGYNWEPPTPAYAAFVKTDLLGYDKSQTKDQDSLKENDLKSAHYNFRASKLETPNASDDEMELIVDNDDAENRTNENVQCENTLVKSSAENDKYEGRFPYSAKAHGSENSDNPFLNHTAVPNEQSSSDSPPSSSFTAADSGHDSNNDTSATSDTETRNQSSNMSQCSPEATNLTTTTIRTSDSSPKIGDISSSGSSEIVSPILLEKRSVCLDSETDMMNIEKNSTKSTDISDIEICSTVRPLDLREANVTRSIPKESG